MTLADFIPSGKEPVKDYLKATKLCDFDRAPEVQAIALELTSGLRDNSQKSAAIAAFVKEMKYVYDDWSVTASRTLARKEGMCSSKTNLMVALLRSIGIPARYRVFRVGAELDLFNWLIRQDTRIEEKMGRPYHYQDHVVAEVLLEDLRVYDLSRDTAYERGLQKLGIPLDLQPESDSRLILASFDEWAFNRQQKRKLQGTERAVFTLANEQLERIRWLGKH